MLQAGRQFVVLDNVKATVEGAMLEMALTSGYIEGRLIGTSRWVNLENNAVWIATGNGLTLGAETSRRSVLIELETELSRPEDRPAGEFLHADLLGWVSTDRSNIVSAVLSIVSSWAADGMNTTPGPRIASFEGWSAVVGSVLRYAGFEAFLGNETRKRETAEDETMIDREILLLRLKDAQEAMGRQNWTIKELRADGNSKHLADAVAPFLSIGSRTLKWEDDGATQALAASFRPVMDGVYGGLKLVLGGKHSGRRGGKIYRIVG